MVTKFLLRSIYWDRENAVHFRRQEVTREIVLNGAMSSQNKVYKLKGIQQQI